MPVRAEAAPRAGVVRDFAQARPNPGVEEAIAAPYVLIPRFLPGAEPDRPRGTSARVSQRPVILGSFARLPASLLEPFSNSLRATGFAGEVGIVTAGYNASELSELATHADHVHTVDDDYSGGLARTTSALAYVRGRRGIRRAYPRLFEAVVRVASERESFDRWKTLELRLEGLQSLRYMHYYRCLLDDFPDADAVMITDLRDVIFQRDPFADPVTGLELYLEDGSVRIGQDVFNTRWLLNLFGKEFVAAQRGQFVSCSGTVLGTRDAMLHYLSEMMTSIAWRRRPMGPHDQGIHNALIRADRLQAAEVIPNEHGRVLTLGKVKAPRTNDGFLVNADGSIPAVVHQWDRHAPLVSSLRAYPCLSAK